MNLDEPTYQLLNIRPALPEKLHVLKEIAVNIRWAWHPESADLFKRLDPELWVSSGHNPTRMLGSISQRRLEWASHDPVFLSHMERAHDSLNEVMTRSAWFQHFHAEFKDLTIAYFSAEFGLAECLPFYSGGLGVLAGDHLKSAHELGLPLVGVGLAYQVGYFAQHLNADGWQQEEHPENDFHTMPMELERGPDGQPLRLGVPLEGREVKVQVWRIQVGRIPLYLLDANIPENEPRDQAITGQLYGGDKETRIQHEILLGIGGAKAIRELGIHADVSHINEGHAAFSVLERIRQTMEDRSLDFESARRLVIATSIFTTHTPVSAGFDIFDEALASKYLRPYVESMGVSFETIMGLGGEGGKAGSSFNMALFALRNSALRNGVSRLHGQVSRKMWDAEWKGYPVEEVPLDSVTNGIHARTWISPEMTALFNRYMGFGWSENPSNTAEWERIDEIPDDELWAAHMDAKDRMVVFARKRLEDQIKWRGGSLHERTAARGVLDPRYLTIGFARRFATYKRAALLLRYPERLKKLITDPDRPVQFVIAGKAHPQDTEGKELIQKLAHFAEGASVRSSVVFLQNYDMNVARHMIQGVDVWLNTPRRPLEASGTSGMKAAANGVLNLSVLDGWWVEGFDGEVGWAIGNGEEVGQGYESSEDQDEIEAMALYDLLEREVVPQYYDRRRDGQPLPQGWVQMMKTSIRRLIPAFNSNRMVSEYAERFYLPAAARGRELQSDSARIRQLVDWSRFVSDHWSEVRVEAVEHQNSTAFQVGGKVPVRVRVHLGKLDPDSVSVELYHGRAGADRQVRNGDVTPLGVGKREKAGAWFEGDLPCRESGLYAYAVRVRPRHPDALVPNELNLITWFRGPDSPLE